MKLYRKKLNSVEELKREYIRLNYRKKQVAAADLMPRLSFLGNKSRNETVGKGAGILNLALSLINAKGPLQMALAVAGPVMGMIGNRKKKVEPAAGGGPIRKAVGKLVKEIVVGYIAGKAIQLALRGIGKYLKKRRQQRALLKAEARVLRSR